MSKAPIKPPEKYLDWFSKSKNGVWVVSDLQGLIDRIEKWKKGRGIRTYWLLTPRDRRTIREWISRRNRVGWGGIERLSKWSGFTERYWLGPKPEIETIYPYREAPAPEKSAANSFLPPLEQPPAIPAAAAVAEYNGLWFVDNGHGTRALALGLIPGFMTRFDATFGLGFKRFQGRVPDWLKCARREWGVGRYRPTEEMIQRLCDWSKTNLRWWVLGKGPRDIPPPAPPKAPRANNAPPEKPKKAPESETAYNFFAGCCA